MQQNDQDQKRSGSLFDAIQFGSDFVVIGRELTQAKDKDEVISMCLVSEDDLLLTITEKGYGKRANAGNYRLTKRGAKGVKNIKVDISF